GRWPSLSEVGAVPYIIVCGHIVRPGGPRTIIAHPNGFETCQEAERSARLWGTTQPDEVIQAQNRRQAIVPAARSDQPYADPGPPMPPGGGGRGSSPGGLLRPWRGAQLSRLFDWWRGGFADAGGRHRGEPGL